MTLRNQLLSFALSTCLHLAILLVLYAIVVEQPLPPQFKPIVTAWTVENRVQEEFVQELDEQMVVTPFVNVNAGGLESTVVGQLNNQAVAPAMKIEKSQLVKEPQVRVNIAESNRFGEGELAIDLGEGEVRGEVGALVDGYGAALDRLVQELIRLMRTNKLLVVWMFDESESMRGDQADIRGRLHRVYEELRLVETAPQLIGRKAPLQDVLLTAITSFGGSLHEQQAQPTGDPQALLAAIERIPVDTTGAEKLFAAALQVVNKYRPIAAQGKRKLVLVVVSDESGDDEELLEEAVHAAKTGLTTVYVLGRESVFGSLYAHVRWRQPETGRFFYLPIRRGPETPFAEQLQWDGYRRRRDSHMSGFGPYGQVRLARETGGIFFQLPGEQEDLNDLDQRKNTMLNLREYKPEITSRKVYVEQRGRQPFRQTIWEVIALLNPYNPERKDSLDLPDPTLDPERFTTDSKQYGPRVVERLQQISALIRIVNEAQAYLENVRPLRERESALRWRANYDLMVAQLWWYKLRLFEYGLALDQFVRQDLPQELAKNPMHNRWQLREAPTGEMVLPNKRQSALLGVTAEELRLSHDRGLELLREVERNHPDSPWSRRAAWERERGFGIRLQTYYQPPSTPSGKPQPKPTPPPNL